MKVLRIYLPGLIMLTALTGCEHKDLCFNHPEHAARYDTRIAATYDLSWEMRGPEGPDWKTDWPAAFGISYESLNPVTPEGLCVNSYSIGGGTLTRHLPASGGRVEMAPGINSVLMYNDDTEFIVFDNLNSTVSAKASTRSRSRSGYKGNSLDPDGEPEKTITTPDYLFGHYIEEYDQKASAEIPTVGVTLHPLVFTYYVRYEFASGIEYAGIARGALSGMAESVYLYDGHTGKERATILYDCKIHDWGVEAVVNSFGVPDYPNSVYSRSDGFFGLNLEVKLKNGKTLSFDYDVTQQVALQPHGGVIVVKGLEISDEDGNESGSGFDVSVDGWGEYEDVVIDL